MGQATFNNDVSAYCFDRWGIRDAWPRLRGVVVAEMARMELTGDELTILHPAFRAVMDRQWFFDNYCLVS